MQKDIDKKILECKSKNLILRMNDLDCESGYIYHLTHFKAPNEIDIMTYSFNHSGLVKAVEKFCELMGEL